MPAPQRDPQRLLAEASARIAVRDIQRRHDLRSILAVQWWELTLGILIFPIALGIFLLLVRLAEFDPGVPETTRGVLRIFYGSFGLFVFVLLATYDAMYRKHRAVRRYLEELSREVEDLRRDVNALQRPADPARKGAPTAGSPAPVTGRRSR